MKRKVVITAYNSISALGMNKDKIVENLKKNFKTTHAFELDKSVEIKPIENFKLRKIIGRNKDSKYFSRGTKFSIATAFKTIKDSNLSEDELENCGLFVGSGPNFDITEEFPEIKENRLDNKFLKALWILKYLPNTASSAIAKALKIHGENATIGNACAASTQAIGEAFRKIKDGYLEIALAGGGDSRINQGGILAYKKAKALKKDKGHYIPFSKERSGFIPGEGGAFFLLESEEHAKKRKAKIIAEIKGFGSSIDGHNMTAPLETGKYAKKAIKKALEEAENPSIDLIVSHGTGTELNDRIESKIIKDLYPEAKIIALKSRIGHLSAACGATELAIALDSIKNNFLPGNLHLKDSCNDSLNFIRRNSFAEINNFVVESFGFGGQNAVLIIENRDEN